MDHDTNRVEPSELLEDCWFFGNSLHRKSRMFRSLSEPCTSSDFAIDENSPGKSYEETYRSIEKLSINERKIERPSLIKAPSVPSTLERKDQKSDPQRSKRSNKNRKSSRGGLNRAPSLPISLEPEEFQDEEVEFSMGKLIRQASMKNSDTLPPRTHSTNKSLTPSPSITRQRSRRVPELESGKIEGSEETIRPQRLINQLKSHKSLIDLEYEVQGFKDLGFDFDDKELSPKVISMIPALQEKRDIIKEDEGKSARARRPYLSESWGAQSYSAPPVPSWGAQSYSPPPVPRWGGKRPAEDVKAQIKFWARAVASNVRQEC
ncbi:hypothetical protein STAS_05032 [Striga asiatica]|uniref:Uncharacterized protein n=1 Tax=Striga asiatica TaxID=4170 RepID=A0A5A7P8W0_STRAF|nr:hypothetical protein STAS_05032 [Striga asiatica]